MRAELHLKKNGEITIALADLAVLPNLGSSLKIDEDHYIVISTAHELNRGVTSFNRPFFNGHKIIIHASAR